jgi:hypothetical protein
MLYLSCTSLTVTKPELNTALKQCELDQHRRLLDSVLTTDHESRVRFPALPWGFLSDRGGSPW